MCIYYWITRYLEPIHPLTRLAELFMWCRWRHLPLLWITHFVTHEASLLPCSMSPQKCHARLQITLETLSHRKRPAGALSKMVSACECNSSLETHRASILFSSKYPPPQPLSPVAPITPICFSAEGHNQLSSYPQKPMGFDLGWLTCMQVIKECCNPLTYHTEYQA